MAIYGYASVSIREQSLDAQLAELTGCRRRSNLS